MPNALLEEREHTPDELQHFTVLMQALDLFIERSSVRGDMWRQFPAADKIRELRERVSRIEMAKNMIPLTPQGRDPEQHARTMNREIRADALDIVNYAVFLIKQIDEGAGL